MKLNATLPTRRIGAILKSGHVFFGSQISSDSKYVVYRADQDTYDVDELYSIAIDGSGIPVKLNSPFRSGAVYADFQISPSGDYVVYKASQDSFSTELYSISIDGGGTPVKLNGALPADGDVHNRFYFSSDGDYLVYRADQDPDGIIELFVVSINQDEESLCFPINSSDKTVFICL